MIYIQDTHSCDCSEMFIMPRERFKIIKFDKWRNLCNFTPLKVQKVQANKKTLKPQRHTERVRKWKHSMSQF